LAECTNYQFLSDSTIFKEDVNDTRYYFPNPAYNLSSDYFEVVGNHVNRYTNGYGVSHLARYTYIGKYGDVGSSYTVSGDPAIYNDYARITIPRTVDYVTGITNYFFRGRIEAEITDCNESTFEITIKNISENSGVHQVLKGGTFELYWDNQDSVRSLITALDFSNEVLAYNETTTLEFTPVIPPEGEYMDKYVVVYRGGIQSDADHPDPNDNQALATTSFYCEDLMISASLPYASECGCGPNSVMVCGDIRYVVDIWNFSEKSGSPQNLEDGIFEIYYRDMQGQLIQLASVAGSLDYSYDDESVLHIDLGVMDWIPAQCLIVIYKGQMVDSENPNDEYDGVAIGSEDIEGVGPYVSCTEYY
jgi:hypothetical protein